MGMWPGSRWSGPGQVDRKRCGLVCQAFDSDVSDSLSRCSACRTMASLAPPFMPAVPATLLSRSLYTFLNLDRYNQPPPSFLDQLDLGLCPCQLQPNRRHWRRSAGACPGSPRQLQFALLEVSLAFLEFERKLMVPSNMMRNR